MCVEALTKIMLQVICNWKTVVSYALWQRQDKRRVLPSEAWLHGLHLRSSEMRGKGAYHELLKALLFVLILEFSGTPIVGAICVNVRLYGSVNLMKSKAPTSHCWHDITCTALRLHAAAYIIHSEAARGRQAPDAMPSCPSSPKEVERSLTFSMPF